MSKFRGLVGGSGQGTLIGGPQYLVGSFDVANDVSNEDKLRYFDDLFMTELVLLASVLQEYNVLEQIPNDIGISQLYLNPDSYQMQKRLNNISKWSHENKVKLNEMKSKYIIFSRSKSDFATRLKLNDKNLEEVSEMKLLGIWVTQNLSWQKNCQEMCKKAHKRICLLTKLKYIGVHRNDLIDVYKLFIRSVLEYASVVFHSKLTEDQSKMLESIEKICLKIILAEEYESYLEALKLCSITSLTERRQARVDKFITKCIKHDKHKNMFPISNKYLENIHNLRNIEKFEVNSAKTQAYKSSFIPSAQRRLNMLHRDGKI